MCIVKMNLYFSFSPQISLFSSFSPNLFSFSSFISPFLFSFFLFKLIYLRIKVTVVVVKSRIRDRLWNEVCLLLGLLCWLRLLLLRGGVGE